jgi:hypothetical protein
MIRLDGGRVRDGKQFMRLDTEGSRNANHGGVADGTNIALPTLDHGNKGIIHASEIGQFFLRKASKFPREFQLHSETSFLTVFSATYGRGLPAFTFIATLNRYGRDELAYCQPPI